jgi:hypothetical protein
MQRPPLEPSPERPGFREELRRQRWDDHRYYHHSRINQSLHLFSALSFLTAYVLLIFEPDLAPFIGWLVAMVSRQAGHFFFEPKGFDTVNRVTHEHKEEIKVGYNLRRKIVLLAIWALIPVALVIDPSLGGLIGPHVDRAGYLDNLALAWLALGVAALLFRTVQLFFLSGVQTGLVWFAKILTDPFHDLKLYAGAPLALTRGELLDPMRDVTAAGTGADFEELEESKA